MVAKTYQKMSILTEPYKKDNGKYYVTVLNGRTDTEKEVRWYTTDEYIRMYPEDKEKVKKADPFFKTQKYVLGFGSQTGSDGFITIFTDEKSETNENKEWFYSKGCTFRRIWGWNLKSNAEVPTDLPEGVKAYRLDWSEIGDKDGNLMADSTIEKAIDKIIYPPSNSAHKGSIGERIEVEIEVKKVFNIENQYGISKLYVMEDPKGNEYTWLTKSRDWEVGSKRTIKGTVKEHTFFKNSAQTVLTRCSES